MESPYKDILCPPRFAAAPSGWRKAAARASDFLMPRECFHCRLDLPCAANGPLCPDCAARVRPVAGLYCLRCGEPLPDGGAHCFNCRGSKALKYKCKRVRSAAPFGPELRSLIHSLKYSFRESLARPLGALLAQAYRRYPELHDSTLITPVPLAPKRLRTRGFNQSALLAQVLSEQLAMRVECAALTKLRDTPSQALLDREERLANLAGAFRADPVIVKGKRILLVDDVATTTATLEACAAALLAAGARRVKGLTLARE